MNQDFFKDINQQMQQLVTPMSQFNQLLADNIEQLSKLQLESLQAFNELGVEQLQSLASIQDPASMSAHGAKQLELMQKVSKQLLKDGQKLSEMGQSFQKAATELAQDAVKAQSPGK